MRNSRILRPQHVSRGVPLEHPSEMPADQGNQDQLDTMKAKVHKPPRQKETHRARIACNGKVDPKDRPATAEFIQKRAKELAPKRREHEASKKGYNHKIRQLTRTAHKGNGCKHLEIKHQDMIKSGSANRSITLTGPGDKGRSGIRPKGLETIPEETIANKFL